MSSALSRSPWAWDPWGRGRIHHRLLRLGQRLQRRRGRAGEGVGQLQAETDAQAEPGHGAVGVVVVGVEGGVGAEAAHRRSAANGHRGDRGHEQQGRTAHPEILHDQAAQENGQHEGYQRQQDEGQPGQHHIGNGAGKVTDDVAGHGDHERHGEVGFEVALAAVLDADIHRPQQDHGQTGPAGGLTPRQQVGQQAQQQAAAQRRQGNGQQRRVEKGHGGIEGPQQQLVIQQRQREINPVQRPPGDAGGVQPGGNVFGHGVFRLVDAGNTGRISLILTQCAENCNCRFSHPSPLFPGGRRRWHPGRICRGWRPWRTPDAPVAGRAGARHRPAGPAAGRSRRCR